MYRQVHIHVKASAASEFEEEQYECQQRPAHNSKLDEFALWHTKNGIESPIFRIKVEAAWSRPIESNGDF